jgi:methionyl-tRNA formyltransferase
MRIVVLTTSSRRGAVIIEALARAGIHIEAIIIDQDRPAVRDQASRTIWMLRFRGPVETSRRLIRRVRRRFGKRKDTERKASVYGAVAETVRAVADANAPECERFLKALGPDLLVLGPTRILRPHILSIPRVGVLNPHPGLLPDYRGLDVIPWAIYNGDPLGVTIHFVDQGIDTGDVVAQRRFEVRPGDSLSSVRRRADAIMGELMAEVVSQLAAGGHVERRPQQKGAGRLYSVMPLALKEEVKAKLTNGRREAEASLQTAPIGGIPSRITSSSGE